MHIFLLMHDIHVVDRYLNTNTEELSFFVHAFSFDEHLNSGVTLSLGCRQNDLTSRFSKITLFLVKRH